MISKFLIEKLLWFWILEWNGKLMAFNLGLSVGLLQLLSLFGFLGDVGGWGGIYDYSVSRSPNLWLMTFDLDLDLDLGLTNVFLGIYMVYVSLHCECQLHYWASSRASYHLQGKYRLQNTSEYLVVTDYEPSDILIIRYDKPQHLSSTLGLHQ